MPCAAAWMDLEIIILSEVSQTEKDKYHMISLIYGIENMTQVKLSMKQKHIENKLKKKKKKTNLPLLKGRWGIN